MLRLTLILCVASIALVLAQGQATFRGHVDAVLIDVSVRDNNAPVTGLGAADFTLTDDGVRQTIADVSVETMPLDVTLMVDISQSLDLHLDAPGSEGVRQQILADLARVQQMLRPVDHLQLLRFASGLSAIRAGSDLAMPELSAARQTSLFDSLLAVLMQPLDLDRRRLVIVLTDGIDTNSTVPEDLRAAVLDRSEGVVHLVSTSTIRTGLQFGPPPRPDLRTVAAMSNQVITTSHGPSPFDDYAWALRDVADRTSGRYYEVAPETDFTPTLAEALTEFRTRYVVRYIAAGAAHTGWHAVVVTVPGKKYEIRYRRGYWRQDQQ